MDKISDFKNIIRLVFLIFFLVAEAKLYSDTTALSEIDGVEISATIPFNRKNMPTALALSHDNKIVAFGCEDRVAIDLWDIKTKKCVLNLSRYKPGFALQCLSRIAPSVGDFFIYGGSCDSVLAITFSRDDKFIIAGTSLGEIELWDLNTKKIAHSYALPLSYHDAIHSIIFNSNNIFALSSHSGDACIDANHPTGKCLPPYARLWSLDTGKNIQFDMTDCAGASVFSVDVSQDLKFVAATHDSFIRLWDTKTMEWYDLDAHQDHYVIGSIAFSPDGHFLLSGSGDGTAKLWNLQTRRCVHIFSFGNSTADFVTFSPDNTKIAISWYDSEEDIGTVTIYTDLETQRILQNLKSEILALACAMHPPLGTKSPANSLTPDLLVHIYDKFDIHPWAVFEK